MVKNLIFFRKAEGRWDVLLPFIWCLEDAPP